MEKDYVNNVDRLNNQKIEQNNTRGSNVICNIRQKNKISSSSDYGKYPKGT